jgi:Family of unknown function (DUF5939)
MAVNEALLERRLSALETARQWGPRVVSRLEAFIRSGEDDALFRVNPIKFAADKGIAEPEAIDLFLHATAEGLFEIDWMLLCSRCGCVTESFSTMNKLHDHGHCNLCRIDLDVKLDDYIAVTFTISPQIRTIRFHRPEELSAEDFPLSTTLRQRARDPTGGSLLRPSRTQPWQ